MPVEWALEHHEEIAGAARVSGDISSHGRMSSEPVVVADDTKELARVLVARLGELRNRLVPSARRCADNRCGLLLAVAGPGCLTPRPVVYAGRAAGDSDQTSRNSRREEWSNATIEP